MIRLPASTLPATLIIAASVVIYAFWLTPLLETAQAEHARLITATQTTIAVPAEGDNAILARLAAPAVEDDALIRQLTILCADVQTTYTLGPWQGVIIADHPHQQRRLDLSITGATDAALWPLISALHTRLPHLAHIDSLRLARSGDASVTGTITITLVRANL